MAEIELPEGSIVLYLGPSGELIARIPSGEPGPRHPDGRYKQPIPATEAGFRVLVRILQEQKRLRSAGQRVSIGTDAAPTQTQIEEWLRANHATKVQIGKPTTKEPYPEAGISYEDLFS